jgi:membrane-associated phospholipid phosphatase
LKLRAAQFVSFLGHPFIFTPVVALLVGWRVLQPEEALLGVLTIVVACLLPMAVYIYRQVHKGEWSDLDVSERKDRPHLFVVGVCFLVMACLALYLTHQSPAFLRGCTAAIVLVGAAWSLNFWLKPSMHAGFAMLTSFSLWSLGARIAFPLTLFAILVGWSRIVLVRHTKLEVVVGLLLGAIVARVFFA